jgi:hypothetical protein
MAVSDCWGWSPPLTALAGADDFYRARSTVGLCLEPDIPAVRRVFCACLHVATSMNAGAEAET